MEQHARVKVTVAAKRLGVNPWALRRWIYALDDLVAIVTSFAARLYGQRRGRQKTLAELKALQEPTP